MPNIESINDKAKTVTKELNHLNELRVVMRYGNPCDCDGLDENSPHGKKVITECRLTVVNDLWDNTNDDILMGYHQKEIYPIISHFKHDFHAVFQTRSPLVTFYDVERICHDNGLPLDYFKTYCKRYMEWTPWIPEIQDAMKRIFSPKYAVDLKAQMDKWASEFK